MNAPVDGSEALAPIIDELHDTAIAPPKAGCELSQLTLIGF